MGDLVIVLGVIGALFIAYMFWFGRHD